jgi:Transposase IS116/IS110/IS902 family
VPAAPDRIRLFDDAVAGMEAQIAAKAAPWQRETGLLKTLPGFGDAVAQAWIAEIGPAPHLHFASHHKLACWVSEVPFVEATAREPAVAECLSAGQAGRRRC